MIRVNVIRAWKDSIYRASLRTEELELVPSNPAGLVEVTDEDLKEASGLAAFAVTTYITCTESTFRRFRCCP
jgi:mersacidin/lichenicidin family type 2 lantibiotic